MVLSVPEVRHCAERPGQELRRGSINLSLHLSSVPEVRHYKGRPCMERKRGDTADFVLPEVRDNPRRRLSEVERRFR
jgi:hypothetical protein